MKKNYAVLAVWIFTIILSLAVCFHANAQDYVSPTESPKTGRSPGVKIKLISDSGASRTYVIVFAPGDEVVSGLNEFARNYQIKSAHFTAIGDAVSAKFGWYDSSKKMFKVNQLTKPAEITSMIGDIALYNNMPVVHAHINLATEDGLVHGGHLLEAFVAPTLEVFITIEKIPLHKKLAIPYEATVIAPDL